MLGLPPLQRSRVFAANRQPDEPHLIDAMQVKSSRKTGLFVCKAWIMTRHSIYNGSKGGVCLTLAHTLPPSVLNARKGTPYNKCVLAVPPPTIALS